MLAMRHLKLFPLELARVGGSTTCPRVAVRGLAPNVAHKLSMSVTNACRTHAACTNRDVLSKSRDFENIFLTLFQKKYFQNGVALALYSQVKPASMTLISLIKEVRDAFSLTTLIIKREIYLPAILKYSVSFIPFN